MRSCAAAGSAMITACALLLATCGGPSGVLRLGPDTWRVSNEALTLGGAEASVLRAAEAHCAGQGRQMMVQSISSRPSAYGSLAAASVNFRCLAEGEPALARPNSR